MYIISMEKYEKQILKLENEELEMSTSDVSLYLKLFAYYLVQNKLWDAKFLWKRIPQNVKAENCELSRLYVLLQALLTNNLSAFFENINNNEWTVEIKSIMDDLLKTTQDSVLNLIGKAYTSILGDNLIDLTNINQDHIKEKILELEWNYESDGQQLVIHPKPSTISAYNTTNSEYQLSKLTEFVSFLEN